MLRDHGQAKKYYHDVEGYNGRLDAIQAGILHVKLGHLAKWNFQRRDHAAEYHRLLTIADCGVIAPHEPSWSKAVYHLYVVRTEDREAFMNHLKEAGIGTAIHYPIPLHLQKAYASLNYQTGRFPRVGNGRVGNRIVANISAPDAGAAEPDSGGDCSSLSIRVGKVVKIRGIKSRPQNPSLFLKFHMRFT